MSKAPTLRSEKTLEVASDPRLSRGVKAFLKVLNSSGGPPLETLPPIDAREVLFNAQASVPVDLSGIEESERTITADGYTIKLNVVRPEGVDGKLPVFIFIHGGGWVLGDYPTHKRMVRDLVVLSGMAGVFVNYTRTPDARYPQAINEIFAATKWVAEHGEEIGVDGKNLAVVGSSVGGNMTAVTALKAKEQGGPDIKLQIMMWPIVDANFDTESYRQFGENRFLTTPLMKWMYDLYTTDPKQRKEIYASPLQATVEQLKGLPPALIQVGESDILRDEGEAYGRKLDEAGVRVTTVRYDGMIHDFGMLNGLATEPATRSLFEHAAAELRKYLQPESDRRTAVAAASAQANGRVTYKTTRIDELDIFYREAGSPENPTLLLLHGFPTSSQMFRNLMPQLADSYHLVAPDYPGYGNSSAPPVDQFEYTFDNLANVIDKFTQKLELDRYSLYVMDYGAPVGYRLAVKHPERVQALIVQNGNAYEEGLRDFWIPIKEYWKDRSEQNAEPVRKFFTYDATKWQYTNGVRNVESISPDTWTTDQYLLDRPGNKEIQLQLFYSYGSNPPLYPQWQAYFRKYQPPTLIVWGKNDFIFPAEGAEPYKRDLKNLEFHFLDTGHFALEEDGELIAGYIRNFLAKHVNGSNTAAASK